MTWAVPNWWAFVLLALAAFRCWRLLAVDTILERPREAAVGRVGDKLELFLLCPYCCGAWVSLAWWLAWETWPRWSLVAASPWALSAVVGLLGSRMDEG